MIVLLISNCILCISFCENLIVCFPEIILVFRRFFFPLFHTRVESFLKESTLFITEYEVRKSDSKGYSCMSVCFCLDDIFMD